MQTYYLMTLCLASLALANPAPPPGCGHGNLPSVRCSSKIFTKTGSSSITRGTQTTTLSSSILVHSITVTSTPIITSTKTITPVSDPTEVYTHGTSFPTAIPRLFYLAFDTGSYNMYLSLGFNKNSSNPEDLTIFVGKDIGKYFPSLFRFDYLNKKFYTFDFTGQRYASLPLNPNYDFNNPKPRQLLLSTISQGPGNMVLPESSVEGASPLIYHENLHVANAFVLCGRGDDGSIDEKRDVWAEACPDGGFGAYGRGWLSVRYLQ